MGEDVRIIEVRSCHECPYKLYNDGGGHCSAFITCEKYKIMLFDWGGPENFDVRSGIYPDCKLEKQIV